MASDPTAALWKDPFDLRLTGPLLHIRRGVFKPAPLRRPFPVLPAADAVQQHCPNAPATPFDIIVLSLERR